MKKCNVTSFYGFVWLVQISYDAFHRQKKIMCMSLAITTQSRSGQVKDVNDFGATYFL